MDFFRSCVWRCTESAIEHEKIKGRKPHSKIISTQGSTLDAVSTTLAECLLESPPVCHLSVIPSCELQIQRIEKLLALDFVDFFIFVGELGFSLCPIGFGTYFPDGEVIRFDGEGFVEIENGTRVVFIAQL